jgi:hypothetical protein
MKRHLETETTKLKEFIDRSTDKTKMEMKNEMKTGQEVMKKDVAEVKKEMTAGQEEMKKDVAEVKA